MSELLQNSTPPDTDTGDSARPIDDGPDGPDPGGGNGPGPVELFAPIDKRWKALGGESWGIPTNSGQTRPDGTIVVQFKPHPAGTATKAICYKAGIGAYVITGAIWDAWVHFRNGNLGAPTADQLPTHDGVGRYQVFEHAVYTWHPNTGAHEVHGAIQQRYAQLGGSAWGYPITDETVTPDGRGRFNHFRDVAPAPRSRFIGRLRPVFARCTATSATRGPR